jgi:hypothetical protein
MAAEPHAASNGASSLPAVLAGGGTFFAGLAAFWGRLTGLSHIRTTLRQLAEQSAKDRAELAAVKDRLGALPSREDLDRLGDRLERGLDRITEAGERRVQILHQRFDEHLAHSQREQAL